MAPLQKYWSVLLLTGVVYLFYHASYLQVPICPTIEVQNVSNVTEPPTLYAVFSSSTPSGKNLREYDYAFYLPMTALAWQRIGFRSIIIIIGTKEQWLRDPILATVLKYLDERNDTVTTIFTDSDPINRNMLGQTSRLFVTHLPQFPGKDSDFVIVTDSDLWPLKQSHFLPRDGFELILLHSHCCGYFRHRKFTYRMFPISNIGTSARTWRDIMNLKPGMEPLAANESSTEWMLNYMEDEFGPKVRKEVEYAKDSWYFDQKLVSIRIDQWMRRNPELVVLEVSDQIYERIDRSSWNAGKLNISQFEIQYDSHLLDSGYRPFRWILTRQLLYLMYGRQSWQTKWCHAYAKLFHKLIKETGLLW